MVFKKLENWANNKFEFSKKNFERNWKKGNTDHKKMLNIWKWIALLAFFAGYTLAGGIYSQKVNTAIQDHIDGVNEYFYEKYGPSYSNYLTEHNMTINLGYEVLKNDNRTNTSIS